MKHLSAFVAGLIAILLAPSALATFPDVPPFHPFTNAIDYAAVNGILKGYPDGTMRPYLSVNRAEFVTLISRAFLNSSSNSTRISFSDVPQGSWYEDSLRKAVDANLVSGYPDGTFRASQSVSFVEASKIIARLSTPDLPEGSPWYRPFVSFLESQKAIPLSVQGFDSTMTRGEIAEMLWRLRETNTTQPSKHFYGGMTPRIPDFAAKGLVFDTVVSKDTLLTGRIIMMPDDVAKAESGVDRALKQAVIGKLQESLGESGSVLIAKAQREWGLPERVFSPPFWGGGNVPFPLAVDSVAYSIVLGSEQFNDITTETMETLYTRGHDALIMSSAGSYSGSGRTLSSVVRGLLSQESMWKIVVNDPRALGITQDWKESFTLGITQNWKASFAEEEDSRYCSSPSPDSGSRRCQQLRHLQQRLMLCSPADRALPRDTPCFQESYIAIVRSIPKYVQWNDTLYGPYDDVRDTDLTLADQFRTAFSAERDDVWYAVLDGKEYGPHESIAWGNGYEMSGSRFGGAFAYVPAVHEFAYGAGKKSQMLLLKAKELTHSWTGVRGTSQDALAYGMNVGNGEIVRVLHSSGEVSDGPLVDKILSVPLKFRQGVVVYVARQGEDDILVKGQKIIARWKDDAKILYGDPTFSADGMFVATRFSSENPWGNGMVVNGRKGPVHPGNFGSGSTCVTEVNELVCDAFQFDADNILQYQILQIFDGLGQTIRTVRLNPRTLSVNESEPEPHH